MAGQACSSDDACVLNKQNCDRVMRLTCEVRQLIHKFQCSSTRVNGTSISACFSAGEVDPQEMTSVIRDMKEAVRQLQDAMDTHLNLHKLRAKRGRAQMAQADSGVMSLTLDTAPVIPIQEETPEAEATSL